MLCFIQYSSKPLAEYLLYAYALKTSFAKVIINKLKNIERILFSTTELFFIFFFFFFFFFFLCVFFFFALTLLIPLKVLS